MTNLYRFYNNSPWIAAKNLLELLSGFPEGISIHPGNNNDLVINDVRQANNDLIGWIEILDGNGRIHADGKIYDWNERVYI